MDDAAIERFLWRRDERADFCWGDAAVPVERRVSLWRKARAWLRAALRPDDSRN